MTKKPTQPVAPQHKRLPVALGGSRANHQKIEGEVHDTLQARSALERRRASEIAILEMELEQHRRLRDTRLMAAVRDFAAGYFTTGRFVIRTDAEQKHLKLARDLVGEDPTRQIAAEEKLQAAGTTLDELYARAYQTLAEGLSHHEKRIESLEKRRRELMDDFDALRVIAPRMRQNG
ncbi:hypothetical protein DSM110093_03928 (plasmid) [Sulfitobacter sp. DSM 110093]|uniref:hypothetical protein n=1 Tax=Sulfitobacter sp. DSM 110093 TaxID=2883127 RepID=UPI001FABBC3C|nr:hypothetical protein [Sulfitobacter sp. DSM 110093]UOA34093.1 hypothetical protein DSM110093_03928 [Sulfitobacter sp. DSM 110093]